MAEYGKLEQNSCRFEEEKIEPKILLLNKIGQMSGLNQGGREY